MSTPTPQFNGRGPEAITRFRELVRVGYDLAMRGSNANRVLDAMHAHNEQAFSPPESEEDVRLAWTWTCKEYSVPAGTAEGPEAGPWAGCAAEILEELQDLRAGELVLPNDYVTFTAAETHIFTHFAARQELFIRAGAVVTLDEQNRVLVEMKPAAFRSLLDQGRRIMAAISLRDGKGGLALKSKRCSQDIAGVLLDCKIARALLDHIELVTRCAVLVEEKGALHTLGPGYHRQGGGILVLTDATPPEVSLRDAVKALKALTKDFKYTSEADRSRAIVNLIAPCMRMGHLVNGHALVHVIEANDSQAGKGFWVACIRAIYNEPGMTTAKRVGGVGSFDEDLATMLFNGSPFVGIDNLRDRLVSQYFEMIVTMHGKVPVRLPKRTALFVDVSRTTFQITSNGYQATRDAANRSLITSLIKHLPGKVFTKFPEGNLLQHITANQPFYLACIFAIVKHWHAKGKPVISTGHSFIEWTGALNWIVQRVFDLPPLLGGHDEAVARVASPGLSWLRALADLVIRNGATGQELNATGLLKMIIAGARPDLTVPGAKDTDNDRTLKIKIGQNMVTCFAKQDRVILGTLEVRRIVRREFIRTQRQERDVKCYVFGQVTELPPAEPVQLELTDDINA